MPAGVPLNTPLADVGLGHVLAAALDEQFSVRTLHDLVTHGTLLLVLEAALATFVVSRPVGPARD
jgi:hypothetical protein